MKSPAQFPPTEKSSDAPIHKTIRRCSLEVVEGADKGLRVLPIPQYTLVGRSPSCDLVLTDSRASGVHCSLKVTADQVRLKDLNSLNGTHCGEMRIVEVFLNPGTVFTIGDSTLRLDVYSGTQSIVSMPCDPTGNLLGSVPAMQELFSLMAHLAPHPIPVVILGETGTGKTLVAQTLHQMSPRKGGPFVSVNCATLQRELVESILFGHEKGSFTNAYKKHCGVFEQAHGGTLLLDEIGELPEEIQPKLLQVLETNRIRPIGSDRELSVDVRLLTATNRSLAQEVGEGRFRQDLYFRIAGIELTIPALRKRLPDIPLLTNHFLSKIVHQRFKERRERIRNVTITPAAMSKLTSHPWPGNVRELYYTLERALVLAQGESIEPDKISFLGWPSLQSEKLSAIESSNAASAQMDKKLFDGTFKEFKSAIIEKHELAYLDHLMERAEGNQVRASKLAKISRSYLRTLLLKYGLRE